MYCTYQNVNELDIFCSRGMSVKGAEVDKNKTFVRKKMKTRSDLGVIGELGVINLYSSRQTVLDRALRRRAVQSLNWSC